MRLAFRYVKSTTCLHLSNGSLVNEQILADQSMFGSQASQLFFLFCRLLNEFNLNRVEFALLCAIVFFSNDRPLLIERPKVQIIQSKYMQLFEHVAEEKLNHRNEVAGLANVFLVLVKLKALDVLSMFRTKIE